MFKLNENEQNQYNLCTLFSEKHPIVKEDYITKYYYFTLLHAVLEQNVEFVPYLSASMKVYKHRFGISDEDYAKVVEESGIKSVKDVLVKLKAIRKNYYSFTRWRLYKRNYKYVFITHIMLINKNIGGTSFFEEIKTYLKVKEEVFDVILSFIENLNKEDLARAKKSLEEHGELRDLTYFSDEVCAKKATADIAKTPILVVATMSAGKSTFINSIIGEDLLPSKNEACTAKSIALTSRHGLPFYIGFKTGSTTTFDSFIDKNHLIAWNEDEKAGSIHIEGRFNSFLPLNAPMTIIDTPGPNNSMDRQHSDVTFELLNANKDSHIYYVLNAANLGTDDDRLLLSKVLKGNPEKQWGNRITFILNRMDEIDMEADESIQGVIESAGNYLASLGIRDATIIPYSSRAAFLLQKALGDGEFTRKEKLNVNYYADVYQDEEYSLKILATRQSSMLIDSGAVEVGQDKEPLKQALENSGYYAVIHSLQEVADNNQQIDLKENIAK